jgi:hypothetical protein
MLKRIFAYALIFILVGQNAFAGASSAHVTREANRVITTVNARITSAANSIVAALNSLLRDNKGMNVAQAVREFQATSTQDSAALAKQITAALEGHQAGMLAQDQKRAVLESARRVDGDVTAVTPVDCAAYALKKTTPLAQATQAAYSAAGSNTSRKMTSGAKAPQQAAAAVYTAQKSDPRSTDAGIVLKPGCDPIMAEETAFADELSVVGGYECPAPNLTIPKEDAEKAAQFIARMIVPNPVSSLPIKDRKTPSGVMFEAERANVRARQSYLLDVGQDSLSKFQQTRNVKEGREFFDQMGVPVPDEVSEMDYFRYQLLSRWDNQKFQEYQKDRSETDLIRDLHETILLLTAMQFRQLEIAEKRTPAEMQFFEAVQDGPSKSRLQALESRAGS